MDVLLYMQDKDHFEPPSNKEYNLIFSKEFSSVFNAKSKNDGKNKIDGEKISFFSADCWFLHKLASRRTLAYDNYFAQFYFPDMVSYLYFAVSFGFNQSVLLAQRYR